MPLETEIITPSFPKPTPDDYWKYLATIGLDEKVLRHCCVKKAKVVKLNSRQTITVECDGAEYQDVPVWVHTDCGARKALLKGEEAVDPETGLVDPEMYFKDAALMFPLPEDTIYWFDENEEVSLRPNVLALSYSDPESSGAEIIGIIGVISSLDRTVSDLPRPLFPTYRAYYLFEVFLGSAPESGPKRTCLFDVMENKIATIPAYTDGSGPTLPMVEARVLQASASSDLAGINTFLANSRFLKANALLVTSTPAGTTPGNYGSTSIYYGDDGPITPAFELVESVGGTIYDQSYIRTYAGLYDDSWYHSDYANTPTSGGWYHTIQNYLATVNSGTRYTITPTLLDVPVSITIGRHVVTNIFKDHYHGGPWYITESSTEEYSFVSTSTIPGGISTPQTITTNGTYNTTGIPNEAIGFFGLPPEETGVEVIEDLIVNGSNYYFDFNRNLVTDMFYYGGINFYEKMTSTLTFTNGDIEHEYSYTYPSPNIYGVSCFSANSFLQSSSLHDIIIAEILDFSQELGYTQHYLQSRIKTIKVKELHFVPYDSRIALLE
jgi:hypothetical protein